MVESGFEESISGHPALTSVISFPKRSIKSSWLRFTDNPIWQLRKLLKAAKYDAVFDLQGLARSGLLTWFTGAAARYGPREAREGGWLAYTHRVPTSQLVHTVDRMVAVVAACGIKARYDMQLHAPQGALDELIGSSLGQTKYVLLAPTSRWPAKQWPATGFAKIAEKLLAQGLDVVVVGGKSERAQCGPIMELCGKHPRFHDCMGATTIGQLMALVSRAALVIANDSAALHMAVGFNRALIALFGPTDVARVGPYKREADVIQHLRPGDVLTHKNPANVAIMERITVDEVWEMVTKRL